MGLARDYFLNGDYDAAAEMCRDLTQVPDRRLPATILWTDIDLQVGRYAEGIGRLEAISTEGAGSADWHAALADLLERIGRYDEAARHDRRALALDQDDFRARWQLGRVLERVGRPDDAMRTYRRFNDRVTGEIVPEGLGDTSALPDRPEDMTYLGLGFYRYSVLRRQPADLVRRTNYVLNDIYQDVLQFSDESYWPARLAAADLLAERHNPDEAKEDYLRIRRQNKNTPDAAVGLGRVALAGWDFEAAERFVDEALEINAHHVPAHVLLAETRMTERRYSAAAEAAREALAVNPNALEALSVLAAAQLRQGNRGASEKTQARIRAINPRPALLHFTLGRWLSAGRQYDEAEQQLEKAIECAPAWSEPLTELGLLYMETGEEAAARRTLDASFALDSYNARTKNLLELLDQIAGFARLETEHFIIKYDDKQDGVAAPYFAEVLEGLFADVCADFDWTPKKKTLIELFPHHDGFSVRITGRPFIATVGACTGRVIAMQAPHGRPPFGWFNWAGVLRHEFTHTVTLAATRNRIPHWFTEGLAVYVESAPRSWAWQNRLAGAVRRDRLFTLESIDWGFMRPRRPGDRQLAYAQSEWMVEYIVERHGYAAILDLLKSFRDGKSHASAFRDVLSIETAAFDSAFKVWATAQVRAWGLPVGPIETPEEVEALLADDPDNAALLGRLARAALLSGDPQRAEQSARKALRLDKHQSESLEIVSRVLIARMLGEKDEAVRRDLLEQAEPNIRRLHDLEPDNPIAIQYLAYVEQAWQQWDEAIELFMKYQRRYPSDPDSYRRLAGIHLRRKALDDAVGQLERLARLSDDEPAVPRQIATICLDRDDPKRAAVWLRRAIEIDPYDVDTHVGLAEASLAAGDLKTAEREFKAVCRLRPEEPTGYEGLGRVHRARGDAEKAKEYEGKAEARGS